MEKQLLLQTEKKHTQNWAIYNLAKTREKRMFIELLHDLCKIIPEPEYKMGRPPTPLKDLVFCLGLKTYTKATGRKAVSDYELSKESKKISKAPQFNTMKDFLNCPGTYDLLKKLLTISAIPLRKLEDKYSMDASGFGSYTAERWNKVKWGRKVSFKDYMKGNILIGTRTNVICSCEVTPGTFHDIKQAPRLIIEASANFKMKEISADKGYSSKAVHKIIKSIGAFPYIPFQKRIREPKEGAPKIWNECFLLFRDNKEKWKEHYHKRSNVETTFAMVKRNLGEYLFSKNYVAQRNELMMKFTCHNITCLIQEMFEHGIKIDFYKCNKIYVEPKVPEEYITKDASKIEKYRNDDSNNSGDFSFNEK